MKIYNNISEAVGGTPLLKINSIGSSKNNKILAKLEFYNPTSSIKDRIAVSMVDAAEEAGLLAENGVIIEPTSGNTGLGLAMVAAARGYRLIITMPESMSIERRALMRHLGADIVLTPAEDGMTGAIEKAEAILQETPGAFMPQQFNNPANPKVHYETTGREIWADTDGEVDIFVAGVGTGGTVTGVGRLLKELNPAIKVIAIEPEGSAILSGREPGKHTIQGIGAGFVPDVLDQQVIDEIITVSDADAIKYARLAAREEGILCGISSGAALAVAHKLAQRNENTNKTIVTILPDTAERYITAGLFHKLGA